MKKCALITGGSRGIGRAICQALATARPDYHILINYSSNRTAAEETLALVEANGATGEILGFNVADGQQVRESLGKWQEKNPEATVDIVVNNAGITRDGLFMWMPEEDWKQVIQTSVDGFFHVTQFFLEKMLVNKFGRIINMVSVSGQKGTSGQTNYSAAKAAVIGATKALAQEVAKKNITVNAVAPGFIRTEMTQNIDEKEVKRMIPAQRFGTAEEVAALVTFLASDMAGYITGEVININGGIYS